MRLGVTFLRGAIRAYQLTLSPLIGRHCRYLPTCSAYAMDAVETHGAIKGAWLAVKRVGRCHPWGGSGYDPVPGAHERCDTSTNKPTNPKTIPGEKKNSVPHLEHR